MGYDSEFTARARAAWLELTKPHQYATRLRAYACSACRKWHLSSKYE